MAAGLELTAAILQLNLVALLFIAGREERDEYYF